MLGGLKGGKRRWAPADEGRQWWVVGGGGALENPLWKCRRSDP